MTIDRAVLCFAGFMVLLSALLVWLFSPWWLLLTAFVGAEHDAGERHWLLPGRDDIQGAGRQAGRSVPISTARNFSPSLKGRERSSGQAASQLDGDRTWMSLSSRACSSA